MPLKDYLAQFNPALLNIPPENYAQFKAALEKEYDSDISGANAALAEAQRQATEGTQALTEENQRLKAANWDMWQKLPAAPTPKATPQTSQEEQDDDLDDEAVSDPRDFFKPPTQ